MRSFTGMDSSKKEFQLLLNADIAGIVFHSTSLFRCISVS